MTNGVWWREPPVNRDAGRAALEGVAEELEDARVAVLASLELVKMLSRSVPARVVDPIAERQVLGWMLSGRASLSDFEELRPAYDFTGPRRVLAAFALELIETADPRFPAERSCVYVMLDTLELQAATEAELELWRLPYPQSLPTRAIDLVAALGRAWSVVDDAYRGT